MSLCPYCKGDCFVSSTTYARNPGTLEVPGVFSSKVINATWNNECKGCGKWSVHHDNDDSQRALVDPDDPDSEEE